jgi:hypothetical protein
VTLLRGLSSRGQCQPEICPPGLRVGGSGCETSYLLLLSWNKLNPLKALNK